MCLLGDSLKANNVCIYDCVCACPCTRACVYACTHLLACGHSGLMSVDVCVTPIWSFYHPSILIFIVCQMCEGSSQSYMTHIRMLCVLCVGTVYQCLLWLYWPYCWPATGEVWPLLASRHSADVLRRPEGGDSEWEQDCRLDHHEDEGFLGEFWMSGLKSKSNLM